MYGTRLDNAHSSQDTSLYSINLINCTDVIIKNSEITTYGVGAIDSYVDYIDSLSSDTVVNYISGNVFELDEFGGNTVRFIEAGSVTVPVRLEYNSFNLNNSYTGNIAIFLSGVSAGSLRYNQIKDYNVGINLMNSSVDLFENVLSSSLTSSRLINVFSGSSILLTELNSQIFGGYNGFSNTSTKSRNINLDNSTFYTDEGHNIYRIIENDTNSEHYYGTISYEGGPQPDIYARHNCFYKGDNIDTSILLLWNGTQDPVTVIAYPMAQECSSFNNSQMQVFLSDGRINDTIYLVPGGNGGGERQSSIFN